MSWNRTSFLVTSLLFIVILIFSTFGNVFKQERIPPEKKQEDVVGNRIAEQKLEIFTKELLPEAIVVTNMMANRVTIIDPRTHEIAAIIPVSFQPYGLVADPQGRYIYVGKALKNEVAVIDTSTYLTVFTYQVGHTPALMDITADGQFLYVGNFDSPLVSVIDTVAKSSIKSLEAGELPYQVTLDEGNKLLYVLNFTGSTVTVIDLLKNEVQALWAAPAGPSGLTILPGGARAYVGAHGQNDEAEDIWHLDLRNGHKLETIKIGLMPSAMKLTPDEKHLFVLAHGIDLLSVLDLTNNQEVGRIQVGKNPQGIAFSADGAFAYIANTDANTISVVDTATLVEIKQIEVPAGPIGITYIINNVNN